MSMTRHIVTVTSGQVPRQVHYRRQGSGPAVMLLHQSPQSSREYEPLMAQWAANFTLIAPDTPGYGLSDPLPNEAATMEELARSMLEFADAIHLKRFGVYGYHTGGGMAIALAHAWPERVTTAFANGLVMPTRTELADILARYLPPFTARWDGSHLAWLWARLREQTIFFPWHDRRLGSRMEYSVPDPAALQRHVREFLLADKNYVTAYRAAFSYDAAPVLPQLRVPTTISAAAGDPLAAHLERIGDRADCVKVEASPDTNAVLDRALGQLLAYPGEPVTAAGPTREAGGRLWQEFRHIAGRPTRLLRSGADVRVVCVHEAGGSALTVPRLGGCLGGLAALDLPGHGESAPLMAGPPPAAELGAWADAVNDAAAAIADRPVLAGDGAGAVVALAAACAAPDRFRALLLTNLPLPDPQLSADWRQAGLPSLAPDWHGGHLSRAWHMVRDARLFFPWFRREPAGMIRAEPRLDPAGIQLEVRELLTAEGAWQALRQAQLDSEPVALLAGCPVPVVLAAIAGHPLHAATREAARRAPRGRFVTLRDEPNADRQSIAGAMAELVPS